MVVVSGTSVILRIGAVGICAGEKAIVLDRGPKKHLGVVVEVVIQAADKGINISRRATAGVEGCFEVDRIQDWL